jgi:hypothetical protein
MRGGVQLYLPNLKGARTLAGSPLAAAVALILALQCLSSPALAQITPAAFAEAEDYAPSVAVVAAGQRGPAPIVEIATTSSDSGTDVVFRRTSVRAAWGLLGTAFCALLVLNIIFFSHLRREYTPKKRPE